MNNILQILIFCIGSSSLILGQRRESLKSILSIDNQFLFIKSDNPIRIVAQQKEPVSLSQLSATFQKYDSEKKPIEIIGEKGYFFINPDSIGIVEINIKIADTVETKTLRVRPIQAVGKFGRHTANSDTKIDVGEFKSQIGLVATVEFCGFDAKCNVFGFQVIRISNLNQVERINNKGGRFEEHTREILMKAKSKDIYIFRKIKYKCPGSEGYQRLDDMIFEIK